MRRSFMFMVVVISPLILLTGCAQQEPPTTITPPPQPGPQEIQQPQQELQTTDINTFLDGFASLFKKELERNNELSTASMTAYDNYGVVAYDIRDKAQFIHTVDDFFAFVRDRAEEDVEQLKKEGSERAQEIESEYLIRWIVEETGVAEKKVIETHMVLGYLFGDALRDPKYTKWVYGYCGPNLIIKIKGDKRTGGGEQFEDIDELVSIMHKYGAEFTEGIGGSGTITNNLASMRGKGICQENPASFGTDFDAKSEERQFRDDAWLYQRVKPLPPDYDY